MKRLLLIIPLLLVVSTNFAQLKDFSWGGKIGLNWATFTGDDTDVFEVKTGLLAGVFARHKLFGNLFIQPGIIYSNKGASVRLVDKNGIIFDYFHDYDYLELPVLFKYFFSNKSAPLKPNLFVGPAGLMKLSSVLELKVEGLTADADEQDISGFEYGLVFGGGLEFRVEEVYFFLELRFARSFTSFDESVKDLDKRNSTFTIATGFTIN
ncbi:MAG: porin family protein [Ignavibacteria bacterium]|jgi:hypothetical protein